MTTVSRLQLTNYRKTKTFIVRQKSLKQAVVYHIKNKTTSKRELWFQNKNILSVAYFNSGYERFIFFENITTLNLKKKFSIKFLHD